MKLAVPTCDKITVSNNLGETGFFKIITFCGNEVVGEEFRPNPLFEERGVKNVSSLQRDRLVTLLSDCDTLIGGTFENELCRSGVSRFINTVTTSRSIITSAAIEYNRRKLLEESNSCCCP